MNFAKLFTYPKKKKKNVFCQVGWEHLQNP